jgi:two-component system, OmpR family, phosphate regulon sensor histidine kinase PhoR
VKSLLSHSDRTARVRFPWRVISRIVMLQAFLTIAALGATALSARYFFKTQFIGQAQSQLETVLGVLARQLPLPPEEVPRWCATSAAETSYHIAWYTAAGAPVCDSDRTGVSPSSRDSAVESALAEKARAGHSASEWTRNAVFAAVPAGGGASIPGAMGTLTAASTSGAPRDYLVASGSLASVQETLHVFDTGLFAVLLIVGLGLCAFSIISSRQLVIPLGQLILKMREASETDPDGSFPMDQQNAGEWVELESSLNRIQTDLRQKTETLSREREELSTLMGAISDAILAVDIAGKPLFFNSRFALLFFDKEHRVQQPHLGEIFRTPDVLHAFHAALREGTAQKANIPLYTRTETTPHYFSLSVAPLRRDIGPVYGAVGIFHDVTELKRAENIRIDFVANVSHELRTPLTAIKGYTDTLREDVGKKQFDAAGSFLEIIARNVDRLMRLIGDLLDLSSLESHEANGGLNYATVDTRELTSRVLAQLDGQRQGKHHIIETAFKAPAVYADPTRVEQVLVNLLENSIKYVPGGGKITVSWEPAKDFVLLRVADNGPGIPAEHHSRLFERFYRIDKGRSRDMGGTGLGLAIVKHIMQRHGGSVSLSSDSGKGTEFVCQFPLT